LTARPVDVLVGLNAGVVFAGRDGAIVSVLRTLTFDVAVDAAAITIAEAASVLVASGVEGLVATALADADQQIAGSIDGAFLVVVTVDARTEIHSATAIAARATVGPGDTPGAAVRGRRLGAWSTADWRNQRSHAEPQN
jgi:hypothetical protein